MPIQDQSPSEQYVFGGIDSQSNPLNMPQDRALRCNNWVPNAGGWLELRRGYTPVASTLGSASDGSGNYSPPPPPPGNVMLDWMLMSAALRAANHLASTGLDGVTASNHLYTTVNAGNFYWTKGDSGFPWDIDPFDDTPGYIYQGTTENGWANARTAKRFESLTYGFKGLPFAKRIMNIGDVLLSLDTRFAIYDGLGGVTYSNLGTAKFTLTGPFVETIAGAGGNLPANLTTIHITYEWSLDGSYNHQSGSVKETYTFAKPYGLIHWQTQAWDVSTGAYNAPGYDASNTIITPTAAYNACATNLNILVSGAGVAVSDPTPYGVNGGGTYVPTPPPASPSTSIDVPGAIHSIAPYETWSGARFLLFGSAANVYSLALATGVINEIGTIASSNPWDWFPANGQIHIGDGVQVWFFDGVTLRPSGIRSLTAGEAAAVAVNISLSMASLSSVTLAFSSGGEWPSSDVWGEAVYAAVWDPTAGSISPSARLNATLVKGTTGQKLVASSLPSLPGSQVWVLSITRDGQSQNNYLSARDSSGVPTPLPGGTSFTVSGRTVTVTSTAHGMTTGAPIIVAIPLPQAPSSYTYTGPIPITVIDANTYSFVDPTADPVPAPTGTIIAYAILTGATINTPMASVTNVETFGAPGFPGLPASTVGGAQPGYQLYACIWNPTTPAVGNRA